MRKISFLVLLFAFQLNNGQIVPDAQKIVEKLSLEQKVSIVVGAGMDMSDVTGAAPVVGKVEEKVPGAAGTSNSIESFGIPKVVFSDGPAGVRINPVRKSNPDKKFYATAFPVGTMMASTFNIEMLEKTGIAFGNECKEYGVDILLAPALNIHRIPLGGRNFEYYSEDPLISGKMAAAFTKGVQSQGIGVSLKHFAANNQETNRSQINTIVSERALREIYLKGFEIAVKESNPWTIMSSYNKINDVYTSERRDLLTTILRDEWGFKGFVMTDWFGGRNPVEQMKAGNDLLMPGSEEQKAKIIQSVKDGNLSVDVLNENVARILNVYFKTPSYLNYKPSGVPDIEQNSKVSREAASEGMVLLKNEKNTLPLYGKQETIALFGIGSYNTIAGGTGSGDVNKAYMISIEEGLKNAGFKLNREVDSIVKTNIADQKAKQEPKKFFFLPDVPMEEKDWTDAELDKIAKNSSVGIFTISRISGEFFDRKVDNDFNLKNSEYQLINKIVKNFHSNHKPVIILLNIGGVIETASWKDLPDAILLVWQPGQEGGTAVADILSGAVNPSGKLPMTFPDKYSDVFASRNFPGKILDSTQTPNLFLGKPSEVIYEEDIYVGYRYFETFKVPVSYPFGYGLSYSTFKVDGLKVSQAIKNEIKIKAAVTNAGNKAGKEVIEIYVSSPEGELKKPLKELKAFAKTKLLKPGEKQEFEFVLSPYNVASFSTDKSAWILEKGKYTISAGTSVDNLPATASIVIANTSIVLKTNKVLAPSRIITILK